MELWLLRPVSWLYYFIFEISCISASGKQASASRLKVGLGIYSGSLLLGGLFFINPKKHTPSLFTSPFFDIYLWTKNRKWEWKEWKSNRASASATAVSTREKRPSWPVTHSAAIANGKDKPYGTYEYTTQLSTDTIINLNHSNHIDLFWEILTLKFIINSHIVSS